MGESDAGDHLLHRRPDDAHLRVEAILDGQAGEDLHDLAEPVFAQRVSFPSGSEYVEALVALVNGTLDVRLEDPFIELEIFSPGQHAGRQVALRVSGGDLACICIHRIDSSLTVVRGRVRHQRRARAANTKRNQHLRVSKMVPLIVAVLVSLRLS